MSFWITNANIIFPDEIRRGDILVEGEAIAAVRPHGAPPEGRVADARGLYLSPGFIDIHTHGAAGVEFSDTDAGGFYRACRAHLEHGTTTIVPTTLSGSREGLMEFIRFFNTLDLRPAGGPEIAGLHLEGPYFADAQRGAQNPAFLRNPDPEEYEAVLAATDRIRRWSFAVELEGAGRFLRRLCEEGVVASLAHSDATCAQVEQAHRDGLAALTHFYSGMASVRRIDAYRVAGAVEAGYLIDDLYCEVIADGRHLPAELLRLIYKVKGADRICLVTDSMRAACMPEGEYELGGLPCIVEDGVAKLADRTAFAGSVATTDRLVRTFRDMTGAPLAECVRAATLTPARLMGLDARKGRIGPGMDADLLLFDENISIRRVFTRGQEVFAAAD